MAGLTNAGFTPLTYDEIVNNIESRLEVINPGFDFSPESPDGQLIGIFGYELAQAWSQLGQVYNSYNPRTARGQALRNLGIISGITRINATRSYSTVELTGVAGTSVPAGSLVSDSAGNQFQLEFTSTIPASVGAVAVQAGPVPVAAGSIVNIDTPVVGWDAVAQSTEGDVGGKAQTDAAFRNYRNRAVMNASESVSDALLAKLLDLGDIQVDIQNNDGEVDLADGTPPQHIHVTITEAAVLDEDVAEIILAYKSLGTPTFGSTSVVVNDSQGNPHTINFTKATAVNVEIDLDVTFLSPNFAGAEEAIKRDLVASINALLAGQDVIWSRLFQSITPYGTAQVNSLLIGEVGGALGISNITVGQTEYALISESNINITVT